MNVQASEQVCESADELVGKLAERRTVRVGGRRELVDGASWRTDGQGSWQMGELAHH